MIRNFTDFRRQIIMEALHPELQAIIKAPNDLANPVDKKELLATAIKKITTKGEYTGIEGNMPKGSSRAYLKHRDLHDAIVDGYPTKLAVGTKFAIKAQLDKFHNHRDHDGLSLGALQNEAEAGDSLVNSNYRILRTDALSPKNFITNKERGILPPLIDHDHRGHQWSQVGHAKDITSAQFREHTKTKEFPEGISHNEFSSVLERYYEKSNGRYWEGLPSIEEDLNKVEEHPLVQKFLQYHADTQYPPHDYRQIQNLGVWQHPDGTNHIVARDHGFSTDVAKAYTTARKKQQYKGI